MHAVLVSQSSDLLTTAAATATTPNFPSGCRFSPDGLCVLTYTVADAKLRLYNTPTESAAARPKYGDPVTTDACISGSGVGGGGSSADAAASAREWTTALSCEAGEAVRSYAWYPHMKSDDPPSCCFVAVAR